MKKTVGFLVIFLLLYGCAAKVLPTGGAYQETTSSNNEISKIIIYRKGVFLTKQYTPAVSINSYQVGFLPHKSYIETEVNPGNIQITIGKDNSMSWVWDPIGRSTNIKKGETKYFEMEIKEYGDIGIITPWFFSYERTVTLDEVPKSTAENTLKSLKRSLGTDLPE